MPRKTDKSKAEIKEKLKYIGLDFNKIPDALKEIKPLKFKPSNLYEEGKHRQYRYVSVKDIELLLTPTNRLDEIKEKYAKASHIYEYLVPDKEENIIKHTTLLNMLKKVKIEEIEQVEEEQKKLNKNIPFKVKYPGNYLWQIYYSEATDRYFMLVPTEDSDYSTFFYILKKQLEKKKAGKVFVPISHIGYSNKYLRKSEFEDIENYLWLFTKDWPMIYEVYDKKDDLTIQIIGETTIYGNIKTPYKVKIRDRIEANQFYRLIKALFMLQTEAPHYYKFETSLDKQGSLEFFYEGKKIEYKELPDFIKNEYLEAVTLHEQSDEKIIELQEKLEVLKQVSTALETEYIAKEKQISTFLECKKSFFGKVKYFFKYNKKSSGKSIREKIEETKYSVEDEIEKVETTLKKKDAKKKKEIKPKEYYTIEELIENVNKYYQKETKMKNLTMDINAIKLKNKNLNKKIENATAYIAEIDSHKKSIFEFWKYSNKDEVSSLPEGEAEEVNVKKKISKIFDYKEDLKDFGKSMDRQQRKQLSKEELDSLYISTTNVVDILNKVKTNNVLPKDIESALKAIKKEAKEESALGDEEEFDIFGGKAEDNTKIKKIADKKHRELPKDKYQILELNKNTRQLGYKLSLERILGNIESAISKIKITENIPVYIAINDDKLNPNNLNIFNLNPEEEIKKALKEEGNKINLYKINLTRNSNGVAYTNCVFYDNKNKTLPIGMDLGTNILFDISKSKLKKVNKKTFRVGKIENDDKIVIKTVNVIEYNLAEEVVNGELLSRSYL